MLLDLLSSRPTHHLQWFSEVAITLLCWKVDRCTILHQRSRSSTVVKMLRCCFRRKGDYHRNRTRRSLANDLQLFTLQKVPQLPLMYSLPSQLLSRHVLPVASRLRSWVPYFSINQIWWHHICHHLRTKTLFKSSIWQATKGFTCILALSKS